MSAPRPAPPSEASLRAAEAHFTPERITTAWQEALALWSIEVNLTPPEPLTRLERADPFADEPLAYINLVRRQVVVNYPLLHEVGAAESLTSVLAHEVGHHLKYPHTLGLSASLQLLGERLIPNPPSSLTNLFFDLLVNEEVGRTRSSELAAVYRGFASRSGAAPSPMFRFYLAIYEELWGLPPGELTRPEQAADMETRYPGSRADARMFAQTFYALPDIYLQFVYFCSRIVRYLDPICDAAASPLPLSGDVPQPDLDDYAGAMGGNSALDRALEEASERGWIEKSARSAAENEDGSLAALHRLLSRRPGTEVRAFTEAIVGQVYQRLADRHLIRLPETAASAPDPLIPTVAVPWEAGESLRTIDWTLSVLAQGPLAPLQPLRRELEVDIPAAEVGISAAVEIYLDTSGSMPNPLLAVNAMTLAAQIVSAAALRKGGRVKAVVYSSQFEESPWLQSEEHARRFLLRYSGGGTAFPFGRFVALAEERRDVIRVIVSDGDFLANVQAKGAREHLHTGLERSRLVVALLALPAKSEEALSKAFGATYRHPCLRIGLVPNPADLPRAAAQLTRALWGG